MAKRLGNFITVHELRERGVEGAALRFFLLSGQYRTQLNFTDQSLEQAASSVKRINDFVARLEESLASSSPTTRSDSASSSTVSDLVSRTRETFVAALDNDLDTPRALAAVFELISQGNKLLDSDQLDKEQLKTILEFMRNDFDSIFAVLTRPSGAEASIPLSEEISQMLEQRAKAREQKDWKRADQIRDKLLAQGIELQDTPQGQKWRRRKLKS